MPQFIEWQSFEEKELIVTNSSNINNIRALRDSDFNLNVTIYCNPPTTISYPNKPEVIYNEIFKDLTIIEAYDSKNRSLKYKLTGFTLSSESETADILIYKGRISRIKEYYDLPQFGKKNFIIYWLLNSPDDFSYPDCTTIKEENAKIEYNWGSFARDVFEPHPAKGFHRNIINLNYKEYEFIFGKVNTSILEKASFIRFKNNVFPEKNELMELIHLLSYFLGLEFINIGSTIYNESSSPIEQFYQSTFQDGIVKLLKQYSLPPIPIRLSDSYTGKINTVSILNDGIKSYLKIKDKYSLERIIWYINYSRTQHPLVKIQPLSTAFDMICNSFYKNKDNNYIDNKDFKTIKRKLNDIIDEYIEKKDIIYEFKQRISNLNNNSINQRNKNIFNDLKLQLSDLEQKAIKTRNISIHGKNGDIDYIELMKLSNSYFTLINRIVLLLLDQKYYIDYSMQGMYVNEIKSPQKGEFNIYKMN